MAEEYFIVNGNGEYLRSRRKYVQLLLTQRCFDQEKALQRRSIARSTSLVYFLCCEKKMTILESTIIGDKRQRD